MTEVILRKRAARAGEFGLFPVETEGEALMRRLKVDRDVGCDVIARRNPRQHRLFFAICKFVQTHCEGWELSTVEQVRVAIKVATHCGETVVDLATGTPVFIPRSMSFAAMDQTKFDVFFQDACDVVAKRWMREGTTSDEVRRELLLLVDGPHALDDRRPGDDR